MTHQYKFNGIEIFIDIDGTLVNDSSLITTFYNLRMAGSTEYDQILENQTEQTILINETTNFLRPFLKEFLISLNQIKQQHDNLVQFSICTSNKCIQLYSKIIQLIERQLGITVFKNYLYSESKIKKPCKFSQYKKWFIVDNRSYVVDESDQDRLLLIKTFLAQERISQNVYNIYKKYLLPYCQNNDQAFDYNINCLIQDVQETDIQKLNNGVQTDEELLNMLIQIKRVIYQELKFQKNQQEIIHQPSITYDTYMKTINNVLRNKKQDIIFELVMEHNCNFCPQQILTKIVVKQFINNQTKGIKNNKKMDEKDYQKAIAILNQLVKRLTQGFSFYQYLTY